MSPSVIVTGGATISSMRSRVRSPKSTALEAAMSALAASTACCSRVSIFSASGAFETTMDAGEAGDEPGTGTTGTATTTGVLDSWDSSTTRTGTGIVSGVGGSTGGVAAGGTTAATGAGAATEAGA